MKADHLLHSLDLRRTVGCSAGGQPSQFELVSMRVWQYIWSRTRVGGKVASITGGTLLKWQELLQGPADCTGVGRSAGIGAEIAGCSAGGATPSVTTSGIATTGGAVGIGQDDFRSGSPTSSARKGLRPCLEIDLSQSDNPAELMRKVNKEAGEVAILVNNAAVSEQGDILQMDGPMLDRHYAVNVRGMAMLTRAFVEQFTGSSGGRIINLTSGQGQGPMPDELAYATSKGAVEAFTTSLFPTVAARGITVNASRTRSH